jgi:hypothetical protein
MRAPDGNGPVQSETFELRRSVRNLSRQIEQLAEVFEGQNFQAPDAASPLGPLPTEILAAYEQLGEGPQKRYLAKKFEDVLKIALEERSWREIERHAARAKAAARPPKGSLTSQYETLAQLDPIAGRRFFEVHKTEIKDEAQSAFLERKSTPAQTL